MTESPEQKLISYDFSQKPKENLYDKLQNTLFNLKYKYKSIEEITSPKDYNFYGFIYDASLPTEEEFPPEEGDIEPTFKYSCDIKIIDQTTNFLNDSSDNIYKNLITLSIITDNKDYIPFVTKIGEVIRVHNGIIKPKENDNRDDNNKKIQLILNRKTKYKGNWCIFNPQKAVEPYYFSHSRYPYELQDKKIVEYFKDFIPNYLSLKNSLIYPKETLLINRFKNKENGEATVYILKKVELDDRYIFFIMDESDGCELHTHLEFEYLKENEVVRINDFKVVNEKVIVLNETGNILIFPEVSYNRITLMNRLRNKFNDLLRDDPRKNIMDKNREDEKMDII